MPIQLRLAFVLLPLSSAALANLEGRWTTDYGPMQLQVNAEAVAGDYGDDGGRLTGQLHDGVFRGYWTERSSDRPCPGVGPDGSHHWGRIELRFEGDRFRGRWSYCEEPLGSGGSWNGSRDPQAAPMAEPLPTGNRWILDTVRIETPERYLAGSSCRLLTADTRDDGMRLHYRCTDPNSERVTEHAANFDYQIQRPTLMSPDSTISAQGRLVAQAGSFSASCSLGPAALVPTLIANADTDNADQGNSETTIGAPWCDAAGNCPTLELSCVLSSTQELRRTWVYRWQP
jgi:hypothetical protein